MNSFKVGDKIIYPNQGLGIIENIKKENHFGENFNIFHVRIIANDTLVLVPSTNAEEIGIRKPVTSNDIKELFDFISNGFVNVGLNWKGRYKEHVDLMKSGSIANMALVLKSLYYLNLTKPLSFREKKMMEKAKELVVSEISEVTSIPLEKIDERIMTSLSDCYKNKSPRVDS